MNADYYILKYTVCFLYYEIWNYQVFGNVTV